MASFEKWFEPFFYIADPTKRIFFVYLFSSLVLGFLVFLGRGIRPVRAFEKMMDPRVWLHHSSKIDFQLMFFNSALKVVFFLMTSFSSVVVSKFLAKVHYGFFPTHEAWNISYSQTLLLYTVTSFVVLDFFRFLQHYFFHKIPFLWRFHKVHHSAQVMTPITLYRTHPIESVVSAIRQVIVLGFLSAFFSLYSPALISAYMIIGVNALDFMFNFFASNLRHSHVWLSFGPFNYIFVSPAQHQIHHSRALKHVDKNLGFALSLWDQLFGSFYQVHKKEFLIFGVRGENHRTFWEALKAPFN